MLERVSPSAECATQVFLRRFELPIRSNRILGHSFWKSNSESLDVPAWWPIYLERFRDKSGTTHFRPKASTARPSTFQARNVFDRICLRSNPTQQAGLSSLSEVARERDESVDELLEVRDQDEELNTPQIRPKQTSQPNPFASYDGTQDDPQTAWTRFVRTGQNPNHASPLLQLLADSSEQRDHRLAITAYNFIPPFRRTVEDFRAAVRVATSLHYYNTAIGVSKDALSRQVGQDIFFKFLAYCVQNTLWNTAADLWKEAGSPNQKTLHFAAHHVGSRSGNLVGRFISSFDIVDDLPSKVVRLADRLRDSDPILTPRRHDLIYLCRKIAYLVADSPRCMNTIDVDRLKALFSVQNSLGLDLKLHAAALRTINRMSDKGAKSQVAQFIYSDYKTHYQDAVVPQWMFGTLIAICSAANEPSKTYLTLLEDYKKSHGKPDHLFHTQVMRACVNQGEIHDARMIFQDRYRHTPPKSVDDVNPLVRAYAVVGDCVNAQKQFNRVSSEFGFAPDVRSWNDLLLSYARSTTPQRTFACFDAMRKSPIQPNQYTWSILVGVVSKRGDTDHARKLLKQAESAGFSPPIPMIGAVVDSHLLNDEPSEAVELVIQATIRNTTESTTRLWNSLFRYHAFKANSDAILHTQQTMRRFNVQPDGMTYAALMTALVVQNRTREAVQILRTLHFSKSVNVTIFHYSILIHGFAKEKNVNAATLVYHEMIERFSKVTPSARLAMLYVSAIQAEENVAYATSKDGFPSALKPDFQAAWNSLNETLQLTQLTDMADSKPSPGFKRRSVRNDMESIFLSSLVSFLQRYDIHGDAQEILDLITNRKDLKSSWTSRLQNLSLRLSTSIQASNWVEVDNFWHEIVDLTLQSCSSLEADHEESATHGTNTFQDMIPKHLSHKPSPNNKILLSYRFVLSRQISHYLVAISRQQKQTSILPLIKQLEGHGLQMSGKNWNTAIQAFCLSNDPNHHVLAYDLFEKYMIPNTPKWRSITRGLVGSMDSNRKRRAMMEKGNPELCLPTYTTVVHLAMILLSSYRSSAEKAKETRLLLKKRPGTFRLVRSTPYLRDRIQGMLLRNRQTIGDPQRRPRQRTLPDDLARAVRLRSTLRGIPEALSYDTGNDMTKNRDSIRGLLFGGEQSTMFRRSIDTVEAGHHVGDSSSQPGTAARLANSAAVDHGQSSSSSELLTDVAESTPVKQKKKLGVLGQFSVPANASDESSSGTNPSFDGTQERDAVSKKLRETITRFKEEERYESRPPSSSRFLLGRMRMDLLTKRMIPRVRPEMSDDEKKPLLGSSATRSFWKNRAYRKTTIARKAEKRKLRQKEQQMLEVSEMSSGETKWKPFTT